MSDRFSSTGRKTLSLRTADGLEFEVEESVAGLSETIKSCMDDGGAILLPHITGEVLSKVLEYCEMHTAIDKGTSAPELKGEAAGNHAGGDAKKREAAEKDLKEWDKGYIDVDMDVLYNIVQAAHLLEVNGLLDLAIQRMVDMIKGKTPEQIRQTFGIENDFTPEEEAEIRKRNPWVFE